MPSGMKQDTAVYIVGTDQRMRFGHVVDVAEGGLFVDLLCPNRRREFVPFGRIFFPRPVHLAPLDKLYDPQRSPVQVEVLVPETPVGPWIWQPGEMRCVGRKKTLCEAAVVNWQSLDGGVPCSDIVPMQRIRLVRNSNNYDVLPCEEVPPGAFIRLTVDLGQEFCSLPMKEATALIERLNGLRLSTLSPVYVVGIADGKLQYEYICNHGQKEKRALAVGGNLLGKLERSHKGFLTTIKSLQDNEAVTTDKRKAWMALPCELWQEVFSCLDTLEQTKLRTVCAIWNRILDTPPLRSTVVICNRNPSCQLADFLCLATVYNCLSPGTQCAVINVRRGSYSRSDSDAMKVCDMIQYVAEQHPGVRLRIIHLYGVPLNWLIDINRTIVTADVVGCGMHPADRNRHNWLPDFIATCRSLPCDAIQMTNCRVTLACKLHCVEKDTYLVTEWQINVGTARLQLRDGFECALWEALEAALGMPSDPQWSKLAAVKDAEMEVAFRKILCLVQSGDPRPSSHYRGKRWCVDGLQDLQWKKLSRITLHLLVQLKKRTFKMR
ncbi:uncharacterized protein LOC129582152 [Paramacrobiotus metropolitanus]|uniref:uncharacterized protein LOC129582152 n=1 Tax=Paramacrobiotus metropolitanus TaxID=2943436 RepID=UPI00244638DD|nr:uncharacterized protein LOC129582152 [Paramacrobiotus metropolitanus]XP_055329559.1 uncharacterized protein LOC129582152 [Paramacrobiotus metropolitanus]XP_055329560.1 uncharacterized protein LOC129582152 [Paramacrobiotus metropolitanus]XP_055329561.1 uncharacterized protein LOC129582152 [Paramacrobiotus metropolitanus]